MPTKLDQIHSLFGASIYRLKIFCSTKKNYSLSNIFDEIKYIKILDEMRNRRDEKRRNETEKKRKRKERSFAVHEEKKTGIRHMIRLQRQSMEKNICNSLNTQF